MDEEKGLNSHDLPPEEYAIAMEAKMKHEAELRKKKGKTRTSHIL